MADHPVSAHRLRQAARTLAAGGVVAHATEGVWGLAADAFDIEAVERIVAAKQRDIARGLIVIADRPERLAPLVADEATTAWQRAIDSWPGPNTWLLPASADAPWWLTGDHDTIALRQPAHDLSRALCQVFGGPLVSTSANRSGQRPATQGWQVRARFGAAVDLVLGGRCDTPGQPSTIRDATTDETIRG